jgi:hypothetical protein
MSFRDITAEFQAQINEYANEPFSEELVETLDEILDDYCIAIEERYGIAMHFEIKFCEEDKRVKYRVEADSDLDDELLTAVMKDESRLGLFSFRLQ